ncbi:tripartite tricarboxylate transporter substrate binding protein [Limnohabitans sp. Rim8]|jgi:tripartite-type tricarboxylate transporter receptor subunit TctC|uniref:tripartite tricarboxylate transporter substrate binding protein n=1 Tax=Limnohabitans sp. Rim8 TaxID=1100718 RepID=UPI0025D9B2A1|nr:tripartite tricarboxylate transporter substrate binding protein [Limnohabitans sp. Rim8]
MFRFSRRAIFAALALSACTSVFSQASYPDKPIRLVVPYPPGGFTDILGRQLATQLQPRLGQNVIVDNKGGGGSTIGSAMVARAPADGYTLLLVAPDLAINESLMASRLSYDARKDFSPVIRAAWSPMVLVTHPSVPAKNVSEFLALAKARPGKINFASGGIGTGAHLALELFKTRAGVDLTHVPYKGNGPATSDLLGGQVSAMFLQYAVAKPHVAGGKLVMLATPSGKRSQAIPEVPTIAESGLPGFDVEPWFGIVAPAGTPAAIVNRLNAEIGKIMQQNDVKDMLASVGAAPSISTPQEFGKFIDSEISRWAEVVKTSGAKAN